MCREEATSSQELEENIQDAYQLIFEEESELSAGKRTALNDAARSSNGPSIAMRSMLDPNCTP
jgi:hypothetical protein